MINSRIANSFNRAYKTYDAHSGLQQCIVEILINLLLLQQGHFNCIVDFACGTGNSTESLLNRVQYHEIYGIDFSEKLLTIAKNKLLQVKFIQADFNEPIFRKNYIDLAFCNMGLHWSKDLFFTLEQITGQLKPQGLLAFSVPIVGTFVELKSDYRNNFYSTNLMLTYLKKLKFELIKFEEEVWVEKFDTALTALKSMKNIGSNVRLKSATPYKGLLSPQAINAMFVNAEDIQLSYKIGFFICRKRA